MVFKCVSDRDVKARRTREWYNESGDILGGERSCHPDVVDEMRITRHQPADIEDRGQRRDWRGRCRRKRGQEHSRSDEVAFICRQNSDPIRFCKSITVLNVTVQLVQEHSPIQVLPNETIETTEARLNGSNLPYPPSSETNRNGQIRFMGRHQS